MAKKRKTSKSKYNFTNKYDFIKGSFDLSKVPVKYYMFSVPLKHVVDDIHLVSEISKLSNQLWDVRNVFQRNIDEDRVEKNIVQGYLKDFEKIKFFNPLTVAFVALKNNSIVDKYESLEVPTEIQNAPYPDGDGKLSDDYPVHNLSNIIFYEDEEDNNGIICWDKDSVHAVAVDGQHRLSALKMFYDEFPKYGDVLIPIIAISFDNFENKTLVEYLREIFIDINKNSKPVTKARNIILDDREVSAIFTKDMIHSSLMTDEDNINSLYAEIVDWQSDNPKPDNVYQLTTVIILHRIFSEIYLQKKELTSTNSFEEGPIKQFIVKLNNLLKIDSEINDEALKLKTLQDNTISAFGTFSLKPYHYEIILKQFRSLIKGKVYQIFTELLPYKKFTQKAEELGVMDEQSPVNNYIKLPSKELKSKFINEYNQVALEKNKRVLDINDHLQPLKQMKDNNLLFTVIGQVAIFKAMEEINYLESSRTINDFINAINSYNLELNLFNQELKIKKRFWWDSLATKNKGTKIMATDTAIMVISRVLGLLYIVNYVFVENSQEKEEYIKTILEFFSEDSSEYMFVSRTIDIVIERLIMERKSLDDSLEDDEARSLANTDLNSFIAYILNTEKE